MLYMLKDTRTENGTLLIEMFSLLPSFAFNFSLMLILVHFILFCIFSYIWSENHVKYIKQTYDQNLAKIHEMLTTYQTDTVENRAAHWVMDLWIKGGLSWTTMSLLKHDWSWQAIRKWSDALVSHTVRSQKLVPPALRLRAGQFCVRHRQQQ